MRSRLVWDPAHIVYLENWYGRETRYPNLAQCQVYANQLSQVPQTGEIHFLSVKKIAVEISNLLVIDRPKW